MSLHGADGEEPGVPDSVSPAYVSSAGSPLLADPDLYGPIGEETSDRRLLDELVIPVRSGAAWVVRAGQVCRLSLIEGPQVLDLNLWSLQNPRERFWAARTRQFYGPHLQVGSRLWSSLPYLRPLATVVADSVQYGVDEDGAGCHDLLGTRCDPYVNQLLTGSCYDFHCHSNLVRAVLPHGLTEFDVHDVVNVFQVTGLMKDDGRYFMKPCPADRGDYFELFAEVDLLMAASTCPGGDLSVPIWGEGTEAEPVCNPVKVEVFSLPPRQTAGWEPPSVASYDSAGSRHGLRMPADHPSLRSGSKAC